MSAMKYRIVVEPDVGSLKQNQYLVTGTVVEKESKGGDSE
jgi:hypothetical protein